MVTSASPARHYTPYYIILDSNTDTAVCCILKIPLFKKKSKKKKLHFTLLYSISFNGHMLMFWTLGIFAV